MKTLGHFQCCINFYSTYPFEMVAEHYISLIFNRPSSFVCAVQLKDATSLAVRVDSLRK